MKVAIAGGGSRAVTPGPRWLRMAGFALLGFFAWGSTFLSRTSLSYFEQASSGGLRLTATQLGLINLGTSVAFCVSSVIVGSLADRRQSHGPLLALSCLLTGISMIATNAVAGQFGLLLAVRVLLGLACGPVFALATTLARQAADRSHYSVILGIVANGEALYASALGPVLIIGLTAHLHWTQANTVLALPVLLIAGLSFLATRPSPAVTISESTPEQPQDGRPVAVWNLFRYRNVWLSTVLAILSMVALWTVLIYGPMFWTGPGRVSTTQMSQLMTLMGLAYAMWNFVLPGLSNRIGRKPVCILASAAGAVGMTLMWTMPTTSAAMTAFVLFGGIASSTATFYMGLIPVESVPSSSATASCALVVGASELVGVSLGPFLAGLIADHAGLPAAMGLGAGCLALSAFLCLPLHESVGLIPPQREPTDEPARTPGAGSIPVTRSSRCAAVADSEKAGAQPGRRPRTRTEIRP